MGIWQIVGLLLLFCSSLQYYQNKCQWWKKQKSCLGSSAKKSSSRSSSKSSSQSSSKSSSQSSSKSSSQSSSKSSSLSQSKSSSQSCKLNPSPKKCKNSNKKEDDPYKLPSWANITISWSEFKTKKGKKMNCKENYFRAKVFSKNKEKVNGKNSQKGHKYMLNLNDFADLTANQFKSMYTGLIISNSQKQIVEQAKTGHVARKLQATKQHPDWSNHTGNVRHQGKCGACYAFTAIQNLESMLMIRSGFYFQLSVQQVIDCSSTYTYGCKGGYFEGVYNFLESHGVETDYSYPYTSGESKEKGTCKSDAGSYKIKSYHKLSDCETIKEELRNHPISVGIAGTELQFYSKGVFTNCQEEVNHSVLLVAFKEGVGWKIKNSWGKKWGMQGFAWIGEVDNCQICDFAFHPTI